MPYDPKPIDNSTVELSPELNELTETLARNNHELWATRRMAEGWRYGPVRDEVNRITPLLVPYDELPESEKEYDRQQVEALKAIIHLGWKIEAPPTANEPSGSTVATLATWAPGRNPPWTYEEYRTLGEAANNQSQSLLAFDIASEALGLWPGDRALLRIKALALVRIGSPEQARDLLSALPVAAEDGQETLGLLAGTFKDTWLRTGDVRYLRNAVESYLAAYHNRPENYWTGINAATLSWVLLGEAGKAVGLATEISRTCLAQFPDAAADEKYWLMATVAEAALIMAAADNPDGSGNNWKEAEQRYSEARELAAGNFGHLFSTWRNARITLRQLPSNVVERIDRAFRVPRVAVFAGHRIDAPGRNPPRFPAGIASQVKAAIHDQLVRLNIGVGFATAASGSDILFLEALQERGGKTHIVLPCNKTQFVEECVANSGDEWAERFKAVVTNADETIIASDERIILGGAWFRYAGDVLDGLASMRASRYETELLHLAVWNGHAGDGPGGTADSVMRWRARGHQVDLINPLEFVEGAANPTEETAASPTPSHRSESASPVAGVTTEIRSMIFADVKHFSKLSEQQIPGFLRDFLGPVAALVRRTTPAPLFQNTWGDGLFLVFSSVGDAGRFALRLRDCVEAIDRKACGLPPDMSLRIALHAGPVFRFQDQLITKPNYIGSHVNRTARIEPVTPAGRVYATDLFAALATIEAPDQFRFDYVGKMPLAKSFGRFSLYDVSRS